MLTAVLRGRPGTFRFFSTITTFGTPWGATVDDLHVECCFPVDRETEEVCGKLRMCSPRLLQPQGETSEGDSTIIAMSGVHGGIRCAGSALRPCAGLPCYGLGDVFVGWVERSETHHRGVKCAELMGFAALNPSCLLRGFRPTTLIGRFFRPRVELLKEMRRRRKTIMTARDHDQWPPIQPNRR